jgi:tripartite-type tricarboxylate transporter receptor subunit TctC
VPAKSVAEFVGYAKANPGQVTFATTGIGSSPHLAAELFAAKAGIKIVPVPYKGTSPALTDVLGGQVQAYFDTMQSMPHAIAGKLRALGVATEARLPTAPELPTITESGVAQDVISGSWFAFFLRTAVPADIQKTLADDIRAVAEDKSVQEKVAGMGLIHNYMDQPAFKDFMSREIDKWGKVIRDNDIRVN